MKPTLTEIIHDMIIGGQISAKSVADQIDKPYTTMLREINPYDGGAKVGVDMLMPLMRAAGDVEPLKYLAREMGYTLVPLSAAQGDGTEPMDLTLKLLQEFGELSRAVQLLSAEGMDSERAAVVERAGYNAVMATMELVESLRGKTLQNVADERHAA